MKYLLHSVDFSKKISYLCSTKTKKIMNYIDIILIVITLILLVYCARLKLRQQSPNDNLSELAGLKAEVSNNDIMQYIRDTAESIRPVMESKQIDFTIKCSPESMMGWIDTDQLDKIILLLLSDMIKSVGQSGKITLEVNTNKNYDSISLRLNDNGTKMLNTGIIIAHKLVTLHHGDISRTFHEGQGNTVLIRLPITKDAFITEQDGQETESSKQQPLSFHIPNDIELNVPTIELPPGFDTGSQSLGALVQQAYNSSDQKFLQQAMKCINEHMADSDYDREAFAADMGASVSTLYNKLRALTGKNVTTFIRDIRIKTACRLAKENPDLRVSDIAYRVGFRDPKYFATSFKRVMGVQPKEYFDRIRTLQDEPPTSPQT
jgi:AraC-like DNA-binding protein